MTSVRAFLPLLLCACMRTPVGGESGADTAGESAPAIDTSPAVPEWSPGEVTAAVTTALVDGLPSPKLLRDVYFDLVHTGQDETCPGSDQLDGANRKGCTSASGYYYSGVSTWMEEDLGNGTSWMLSVDFEITDPDGHSFLAGGHASHRLQTDTSFTQFRTEVSGSWRYDGYPGWLGEGVSALLTVDGTVDGQGPMVTLNGGVTTMGLPLYFETFSWGHASCGQAARGNVWVRDPTGAWWRLAFAESCDGCAPATFDGQDQGEVCLPLDDVLTLLVADLTVP